jgi:hypothetical protein
LADKQNPEPKTETVTGPITFVSRPMSAIPKRATAGASGPDLEAAKTLLGLVFENGAPKTDGENVLTASDGVTYEDQSKGRVAANRAKRLLSHVKPDGFHTVTRVYQPEGSEKWEWALWLEPEPAKTEKAASK